MIEQDHSQMMPGDLLEYRCPRADVYQADDGTWGHCMTFGAGFGTKEAAQTDLRFCKDWAK